MRKISVAVPHYNNSRYIAQCLSDAIHHEAVDEIVICDDASDDISALRSVVRELGSQKVRIVENESNLGVHLNKIRSVGLCEGEWVLLFDSDNVLTKAYLDGLLVLSEWRDRTIYAPGDVVKITGDNVGMGSFDYNGFGMKGPIDRYNFFTMPHETSLFQAMLNTCNYLLPRSSWLESVNLHAGGYDSRVISSLDSMTMLCDWFADGNILQVVPGIGYMHRVHPGSSYLKHMGAIDARSWTETMYSKIRKSARRISVCVPNYQRHDILLESFRQVLDDDRVSEVVIMDDCSPNFDQVRSAVDSIGHAKVRLFHGETNLGTFHNKARAVSKCKEEFCVLVDSDNIISKEYLDVIYSLDWRHDQVVCPEELIHHRQNMWGETGVFISYSDLAGRSINLATCKSELTDRMMVMMNTGNFFVPVRGYLDAFKDNGLDRSVDITDVGFFNYLFLRRRSENHLFVCKGLKYIHRVHGGSFYMNNAGQSPAQRERLKKMILS
jgi:glycosyltransferase involved in cell wall biosynthesis